VSLLLAWQGPTLCGEVWRGVGSFLKPHSVFDKTSLSAEVWRGVGSVSLFVEPRSVFTNVERGVGQKNGSCLLR